MQKMRLVCGLLLMFALAEDAHGQRVGGLIKKKVEQATKPKEAEATKDAAQEASLFSFEPNAEAMASYKRGLDVEIKSRNEYRGRLAKLKTVEEYGMCQQATMTSPDAIKVAEELMARMGKAKTPEDYQEIVAFQDESYKAMALKACGEDPKLLIQEQSEVFAKAQAAAAQEAGTGWKGKAPRTDGSNLRDYRVMKELIAKYCSLPADMRQDAEKNGVKVPGTGSNIYWVFPLWFAQWVGPDCEDLTRLDKMLQGSP